MLRHYMSIALRNLARAPSMNLVTLALASLVSARTIVGFWDRSEQPFTNTDRPFAVTTEIQARDGIETGTMPSGSWHFARYLTAEFRQIEATAGVRR